MSDFGVGAELNTSVWIIGLSVGGMLINLVTNVLWYMDMNTCFQGPGYCYVYEESGENTTGYLYIRRRIIEEMAVNTAIFLALAQTMKDWVQAQWMRFPEDKRQQIKRHCDAMKEGTP